MKKIIIIVLFYGITGKISAQTNPIFQGGTADGIDKITFSQPANNIIVGGVGKGNTNGSFTQVANNIFAGNLGDGVSSTTYIQAPNNIFAGGNNDGWSNNAFLQNGNNIFVGGDADGWDNSSFFQNGNAIYAGGNGDGWNAMYYKPMLALPVHFISFTVTKKENTVSFLYWKTASEANSSYFEVERGTDGLQFSSIGKVVANQHSNETLEYTFTDNAPLKGLNYYRLKQVDLDGKYIYTPARALNFENIDAKSVKYYPNPTKGILNIEIDEKVKESKIINVFNAGGIVVNHLKINDLGKNIITIDLSIYPNGVYFIHVKSQTINSTHRVVLQ